MIAQYTIDADTGLRRAIVSLHDDERVVVNHYRRPTHQAKWILDRTCKPDAAFHVVLDQVTETVNAPPRPGGGQM